MKENIMIYPVKSINCSVKLCYSFYLLLSLRLCGQSYENSCESGLATENLI